MNNNELLARIASLEAELRAANQTIADVEELVDRAARKVYNIDPEYLQEILYRED